MPQQIQGIAISTQHKWKRPPTRAASLFRHRHCQESGKLLQCISDAIERPLQVGAGGLHGDDDRDRNSSSDETILDGGRARGIFQEENKFMHG